MTLVTTETCRLEILQLIGTDFDNGGMDSPTSLHLQDCHSIFVVPGTDKKFFNPLAYTVLSILERNHVHLCISKTVICLSECVGGGVGGGGGGERGVGGGKDLIHPFFGLS